MDPDVFHGIDFAANADFILDQERDHFPCRTCGSRMPAIIEGPFCSDCPDREAFLAQREKRLAKGGVR